MRNKRKMIAALIILLAVGFASISTTLIINSTSTIGKNDDFEVIFAKATLEGVDISDSVIKNNGKSIIYQTTELKKAGEKSELRYVISNNSRNYNASVSVNCTGNISTKYYIVTNTPSEQTITARNTGTGKVTLEVLEETVDEIEEDFTCTLTVNAVERTELAPATYTLSGTLYDDQGDPLQNQSLVIFSETPHFTKTDEEGYFSVSGLEYGKHEIYILNKEASEFSEPYNKAEIIASANVIGSGTTTITGGSIPEITFSDGSTMTVSAGGIETATLKAGLYDIDDNLLCEWSECGIDVEKDYVNKPGEDNHFATTVTSGTYVLNNVYPTATTVVIPKGTKKLGERVFRECAHLVNVIIPEGVTTIGFGAFNINKTITSITIPNSVTKIESYALYDLSKLKSVYLPGNVVLDNNALGDLKAIEYYNVSEKNETYRSIDGVLFSKDMKTLVAFPATKTTYTVPDGVETIGQGAFNSSEISSITFSNSLKTIGVLAFKNCKKLESVQFPASLETIGNYSFEATSSLRQVIFQEGLKTIGEQAFYNSGIESVNIPSTVTSIGQQAFWHTSNLKTVILTEGLTILGRQTFYQSGIESVTIPSSMTNFGWNAFAYCSRLKTVTILNGVTSIPDGTFRGCTSLETVTIPSSVTKIGYWAFEGCSSLDLTVPDTVTTMDSQAFKNVPHITYNGSLQTGRPWGALSIN